MTTVKAPHERPFIRITIRTPEGEARARRRTRLRRAAVVVGLIAAICAPDPVAALEPVACSHTWIC